MNQSSIIRRNINRLCVMHGIGITALERRVGLGNGTICRWAVNSPSVSNLAKVADFFGVSIDDLLREEPNAEAEG